MGPRVLYVEEWRSEVTASAQATQATQATQASLIAREERRVAHAIADEALRVQKSNACLSG
jgi:hypothetical protein